MRKSPFPGMDPYLERRWGDVHTGLCVGIRAALQSKLPAGLRARAQEDVLLEDVNDEGSTYFEPDVAVVEIRNGDSAAEHSSVIVATDPVAVRQARRPRRNRWVEIIDSADGNRLVTAIEILSPGNKASGRLNQRYREKLQQYLDADTNVVEIDLLRSSRKRLPLPATHIPDERPEDNSVSICRATDSTLWLVYPMPLRDPLPTIPIPCREQDADVPLELQPIIDRIYLEGGHDDLDYSEPPEPPFSPADNEWANGVIAGRK